MRILFGAIVGFLIAVHVPKTVDIYYDSGLQSSIEEFFVGVYDEYK
jgi:hypothetical protein